MIRFDYIRKIYKDYYPRKQVKISHYKDFTNKTLRNHLIAMGWFQKYPNRYAQDNDFI